MVYHVVVELLNRLVAVLAENKRLKEEKKQVQFVKDSLEHDLANDLLNLSNIAQFSIHQLYEEEQVKRFEMYQNRLLAMTNFYRLLLSNQRVKTVDNQGFIKSLCQWLCEKYQREDICLKIDVALNLGNGIGARKSIRLVGDVITELMQNMLKHAFPACIKRPEVQLSTKQVGNQVQLEYADNGIGFAQIMVQQKTGGLALLQGLSRNRSMQYGNLPTGGAYVKLQIDLL
ncbi:MAG: histidine kinase dimerization/phosphoacceptor domain -containing protein [Flammeovirgaceae bacterium]